MKKLAIIGSRNITNVNLAEMLPFKPDVIVSGGAKGIDSLAKEYALSHNIALEEYKPDYKRYGRGAPLKRNHLIIENCDEVLAVWDGVSKGTAYTIKVARDMGKVVHIHRV